MKSMLATPSRAGVGHRFTLLTSLIERGYRLLDALQAPAALLARL